MQLFLDPILSYFIYLFIYILFYFNLFCYLSPLCTSSVMIRPGITDIDIRQILLARWAGLNVGNQPVTASMSELDLAKLMLTTRSVDNLEWLCCCTLACFSQCLVLTKLNRTFRYRRQLSRPCHPFVNQQRTRQELVIRWPEINLPRINFFTLLAFPVV